jgi:hypothetical protein
MPKPSVSKALTTSEPFLRAVDKELVLKRLAYYLAC